MNACFVATGLLTALGGVLTAPAFPRSRWARAGRLLTVISGTGFVLVGLDPGNLRTTLHVTGAIMGLCGATLAIAALGVALLRGGRRKALGLAGIVLGVLGLAAAINKPRSAPTMPGSWNGSRPTRSSSGSSRAGQPSLPDHPAHPKANIPPRLRAHGAADQAVHGNSSGGCGGDLLAGRAGVCRPGRRRRRWPPRLRSRICRQCWICGRRRPGCADLRGKCWRPIARPDSYGRERYGRDGRMRIVVGMTGASGAVLGLGLLQELRAIGGVETHLVISRWARATIEWETSLSAREVAALADVSYSPDDQGAAISSGSFRTDGMVIIPCSMKTLAAIRTGYGDGLLARAADVTLKERRKLVLVPREAPLSEIHLENMLALARMGALIIPPMPAFYQDPRTVDEVVNNFVGRLLGPVRPGEPPQRPPVEGFRAGACRPGRARHRAEPPSVRAHSITPGSAHGLPSGRVLGISSGRVMGGSAS